jgi:hypothetical protein
VLLVLVGGGIVLVKSGVLGGGPAAAAAAAGIPSDLATGDTLEDFGGYDWRVLAIEDGRALVITEDIIDLRAYNEGSGAITWERCTLRRWLNNDFYTTTFSSVEQAVILETTLPNPDNPEYGTFGGSDTTDRVFLLSIDEANRYFVNDDARAARLNMAQAQREDAARRIVDSGYYEGYTYDEALVDIEGVQGAEDWGWCLRSPGSRTDYAAYVSAGGIYAGGLNVGDVGHGVRPALWLNLSDESGRNEGTGPDEVADSDADSDAFVQAGGTDCVSCHDGDDYRTMPVSEAHASEGMACVDCHEISVDRQADMNNRWVTGNYTLPLEGLEIVPGTSKEGQEAAEEFCLRAGCHAGIASLEDLKMATADEQRNPHNSHNGDQACTKCHQTHEQSVMWCTQCHGDAIVPEGWLTYREQQE